MPTIGIPQGFIGFGTISHEVLLHLHHFGPSTLPDITAAREPERSTTSDRHLLSWAISNLLKHGFIHVVGTRRIPGWRSCRVYGLEPPKNNKNFVKNVTHNERAKTYREKQKVKVPSVFQFRGRIDV